MLHRSGLDWTEVGRSVSDWNRLSYVFTEVTLAFSADGQKLIFIDHRVFLSLIPTHVQGVLHIIYLSRSLGVS